MGVVLPEALYLRGVYGAFSSNVVAVPEIENFGYDVGLKPSLELKLTLSTDDVIREEVQIADLHDVRRYCRIWLGERA